MATPRCMQLIVYDNIGADCSEKKIYLPIRVDEPTIRRVNLTLLPEIVQCIVRDSTSNFYDTWLEFEKLFPVKYGNSIINKNVYYIILMNEILRLSV